MEKKLNDQVYLPPEAVQSKAFVNSMNQYNEMYQLSMQKPEEFWLNIAKEFYWESEPTLPNVLEYNFDIRKGKIFVRWFADGKTNICYNCLDRHVLNGGGDKVAFFWEGNDPADHFSITYSQLLYKVQHFANVLRSKGVKKGDRVAIYMPMIEELVVAMLACARIGAIHSIVFGGFSNQAIADRIIDASCTVVVTCDGVWRGTKIIALKAIVDQAMDMCSERGHPVITCIVARHLTPPTGGAVANGNGNPVGDDEPGKRPYSKLKVTMVSGRDYWWHDLIAAPEAGGDSSVEWMGAEDPLFMLYTSGSTGKPKGVLHTVGGYMVYAATTFKYTFDYHPEDVYWCTADVGWITGHSYVVYGPMANHATSVLFEGIPTYPDAGRCWEVVDKYSVSKFYTAPTAIRTLIKAGDSYVKKYSRKSLSVLGTVGEPINPEAWIWYHDVVGEGRCSVVDTFWQTETGGHVITPLPGATPTKPGSATFPFFGVSPSLIFEENGGDTGEETNTDVKPVRVLEGAGEGYLVFGKPWPGMMRTVYGDHARFEATYFMKFPGYYTTGDGAQRDSDGYFWITGRIDDMLNVSGHLLSTAQIESALVEHPWVAEAAVVAHPHAVKGECTYCFVTLKDSFEFTPALVKELILCVREKIGPFAAPDFIQEAPSLPKTRSGKIMRRVLRQIAVNDRKLGDISTLADPSVVDLLFSLRPENA